MHHDCIKIIFQLSLKSTEKERSSVHFLVTEAKPDTNGACTFSFAGKKQYLNPICPNPAKYSSTEFIYQRKSLTTRPTQHVKHPHNTNNSYEYIGQEEPIIFEDDIPI